MEGTGHYALKISNSATIERTKTLNPFDSGPDNDLTADCFTLSPGGTGAEEDDDNPSYEQCCGDKYANSGIFGKMHGEITG